MSEAAQIPIFIQSNFTRLLTGRLYTPLFSPITSAGFGAALSLAAPTSKPFCLAARGAQVREVKTESQEAQIKGISLFVLA